MNQLLYFNFKKNISSIDHTIFKLLPKSKKDGAEKANKAEYLLDPMQFLYYYGYIIAYGVLHFLPEEHQEGVMNLVDTGILDDIVAHYDPTLANSYVTDNKFYYKQKEHKLPKNCVPQMRYIDHNNKILVDCLDLKGDSIVFHFIPAKTDYHKWEIWR